MAKGQKGEIKIFSGTANPQLAQKISEYIEIPLGKCEIKRFADGEVWVEIKENIRRAEVFIIQPTCPPTNDNLMELLIMMDALRRASAEKITNVIPYYGYARQDRKVEPRTPISAKLVANLLQVTGSNRVVTVDLHAGQIQGFFDIPVDNLYAMPIHIEYIRSRWGEGDDIVIVSPDTGGAARARSYAKHLKSGFAIIDKRRPKPNDSEVVFVVGEVKGKYAIIVDDIIDTAGTAIKAAEALINHGAKGVSVVCTHPILSQNAPERIKESVIEEVVVTDTVPLNGKDQRAGGKIKVVSVAKLLGEAIMRIYEGRSVSELFL
jgi:ribose-phosphate pyrophosphokinase